MAVSKVEFYQEIDNTPDLMRRNGELYQGDTYTNYHIYRILNDDGSEQFLSFPVVHDSYGSASLSGRLTLVKPVIKTVTVFE